MGSEAIVTAQHTLVTLSMILVSGALAAKVADRCKIPDVVLFLLVGILIGPPVLNIVHLPADSALNQLLLILGASFLLFHGGTGISLPVLKEVWFTLSMLSIVAVLGMVVIVGWTAHYVLGIALLPALLLAAVLAPTDPATLVPIFLSVKIKERLAQTVISESAFNDATGAIVTFAILGAITTGEASVGGSLVKFFVAAGGGIVIGLVYGVLAGFLISDRSKDIFAEYAQVLTVPLIIASYMTAEHLGASGFMAVFVAGLVFGNLDEIGWTMKEDHEHELHSFINIGSLLLRMMIFILLGTHVNFGVIAQYWLPGLIIVTVFMFIARPAMVILCAAPDRRARWEKNELLFMFWTRETGVIPAALSGMLIGMKVQHAEIIAAVTFMAILATLVIQASTTPWLARKLDLMEK